MLRGATQARCHARLLGRLRAIEKISSFLLECHVRAHQNPNLTLEMTRQDIADYLGLTVETVSRCLGQLRRNGLITLHSSRRLDLLNIPTLQALSA
jgi:CRP-like cAMP-binding protein